MPPTAQWALNKFLNWKEGALHPVEKMWLQLIEGRASKRSPGPWSCVYRKSKSQVAKREGHFSVSHQWGTIPGLFIRPGFGRVRLRSMFSDPSTVPNDSKLTSSWAPFPSVINFRNWIPSAGPCISEASAGLGHPEQLAAVGVTQPQSPGLSNISVPLHTGVLTPRSPCAVDLRGSL